MKNFINSIGASLGIAGALALFALIVAAVYGWVNNIIKIFNLPGDFTLELVARIVGIFFGPLGAVLGYF